MYPSNKIYIVICEGKSEVAYITELSKLLREHSIPINFSPKDAYGGDYQLLVSTYKREYKNNPRHDFMVFADNDLYFRNDKKNQEKYDEKPKNIPDFDFNYFNFEDFLAMHLDDSLLEKWVGICKEHNHFNKPMHSDEYLPLFEEEILPDYDKGDFPFSELNFEMIKRAIKNNNDVSIPIRSEFLAKLEEILAPYLV